MVRAERGLGMEGSMARSYARLTNKYIPEFRVLADEIAAALPADSTVLEIAPGPGFLAVELARRGLDVTGLDISKTFVDIARRNARTQGQSVRFEWGNAADMPFADASFDYLVCRAAFKNFADPLGAVREMRRVLKPGGEGRIIDLRRDVSMSEIVRGAYPDGRFSFFDRVSGLLIFAMLRRRAYTISQMESLLAGGGFTKARVESGPMGFNAYFERDP